MFGKVLSLLVFVCVIADGVVVALLLHLSLCKVVVKFMIECIHHPCEDDDGDGHTNVHTQSTHTHALSECQMEWWVMHEVHKMNTRPFMLNASPSKAKCVCFFFSSSLFYWIKLQLKYSPAFDFCCMRETWRESKEWANSLMWAYKSLIASNHCSTHIRPQPLTLILLALWWMFYIL